MQEERLPHTIIRNRCPGNTSRIDGVPIRDLQNLLHLDPVHPVADSIHTVRWTHLTQDMFRMQDQGKPHETSH